MNPNQTYLNCNPVKDYLSRTILILLIIVLHYFIRLRKAQVTVKRLLLLPWSLTELYKKVELVHVAGCVCAECVGALLVVGRPTHSIVFWKKSTCVGEVSHTHRKKEERKHSMDIRAPVSLT